jgi:hypothetical protein
VKALTLWQPWGTAMRAGLKAVETRSWATSYRGLLAIHAGRRLERAFLEGLPADFKPVPLGCVLGVVELVDCVEMTPALIAQQSARECEWGDWRPGRFAWVTRPVVWFREPIPAVGHQGLWDWEPPQDWRERG